MDTAINAESFITIAYTLAALLLVTYGVWLMVDRRRLRRLLESFKEEHPNGKA